MPPVQVMVDIYFLFYYTNMFTSLKENISESSTIDGRRNSETLGKYES